MDPKLEEGPVSATFWWNDDEAVEWSGWGGRNCLVALPVAIVRSLIAWVRHGR